MIEATAVVMLTLWLAGVMTSYTFEGFIHILLVIAIVMVHVRVIKKYEG
ncbi:lmo0937 family membrane protein [Polynucleobacter arcticus]|uniref:Lmo0937 family membrane protein n=1 Tax=Polynucleobacter arcticus TaxID=1743165 RepID=A0A6M9PDV6_9BURK|nr:lmo0937 family membrane protein [Polynucleobacter arcticus]QKM60194.1 lmo0937 family membrane protein [Polynucleobacter arcticus]